MRNLLSSLTLSVSYRYRYPMSPTCITLIWGLTQTTNVSLQFICVLQSAATLRTYHCTSIRTRGWIHLMLIASTLAWIKNSQLSFLWLTSNNWSLFTRKAKKTCSACRMTSARSWSRSRRSIHRIIEVKAEEIVSSRMVASRRIRQDPTAQCN